MRRRRPGPTTAIGGAIALVAVAVLAVVFFTRGDSDRPEGLAFNGTALPTYVADDIDPALGSKAPLFTTEYLDGEYAFIGGGGGPNDTAKLVMFVAHWCPVCQAEVPRVAAWVAEDGLPEGVEIEVLLTDLNFVLGRGTGRIPPESLQQLITLAEASR